MKAIVLSASFLLLGLPSLWSSSVGDALSEVFAEARFTILEGAKGGYYYDWVDGQSKAIVQSSVWEANYLSVDIGGSIPYNADDKGVFLFGGTIHMDKIIKQVFPHFSHAVNLFLPRTGYGFYRRWFFGISGGWNFSSDRESVGVTTGLKIQF